MERNDSLQDLVGNLWKLGRTPSEAEFQLLTGLETESPLAGAGMHRVASIDILRKMLLNQQAAQALSHAQAAATATAAELPGSGSGSVSAPHAVGLASGALRQEPAAACTVFLTVSMPR